jgi:hypothetical protein
MSWQFVRCGIVPTRSSEHDYVVPVLRASLEPGLLGILAGIDNVISVDYKVDMLGYSAIRERLQTPCEPFSKDLQV